MKFDRQRLAKLIGVDNYYPLQLELNIFESLASTNQTLWELVENGAKPGTVAIAIQQTAGRGQWGRQWNSSEGGLYFSIALAPNIPIANVAQLTLCSAWGIATTLRSYGVPVLLKWPNDLILGDRKLGGILTETKIQGEIITKAVVGVGINWANPVPETGINLQSFLQETGGDRERSSITDLETLAAIAIDGVLSGYQQFSAQGIESLLPSYLKLLTSLGRSVIFEGYSGVVTGITPSGCLQVRIDSGSDISEISLKPGTISIGYGS